MKAILSLIILMFFLPVTHADITVCEKGCDFSSIQSAIDAAEVRDTIVSEGFFFENLNITKSIILTGNATLYPSGTKAGVSISADNVEVSGLVVKGGITGIKIADAEGVKIESCKLVGNFYGLLLSGSSYCVIKKNNFENVNDSAIKLINSDSNTLLSNHVGGSNVAVHFFQSYENNLASSSFENVNAGVVLEGSLDNNITSNKISADTAIYMFQSGRNKISNNTADGDVFVNLLFSSKNRIEQNEADGIFANFKSQKNDFILKNLRVSGEEFQFSLTECQLPDGFIRLSGVINITIIPDIITGTGYVELEAFESNLKKINTSSLGFYRITNEGMERISENYIENSTVITNVTVKESGLYVFAGKEEMESKDVIPTVLPKPISPASNYYFYLILLVIIAVSVLLLTKYIRR